MCAGDELIEPASQVPSFADCWWSLPQDLQGRILGELDDERRSVITIVRRRTAITACSSPILEYLQLRRGFSNVGTTISTHWMKMSVKVDLKSL